MNAKTREIIYYLGALLTAGVGLAVTLGAVSADQGANIGQALAGLLALLGAGAPALAAKKTAEQRKDGTFESLPSPLEQVIQSVPVIAGAAVAANADLERAKQAVNDSFGAIANAVLPGSLAQQVIDAARRDLS